MPDSALPPAIFLMGPTASGKTELAMALCKKLPCEIISVDSTLVYRGMDIGTAKPDATLLAQFPHRLVNIRDPAVPYSASRFRLDALEAMAEISKAGKIPLLVGGTMLYFKVLLEGIGDLPAADEAIREKINVDAANHGWPYVHAQLAELDPVSAQRIHNTDPQRLQRALEVYRITGVTMTQWRERQQHDQQQKQPLPYQLYQFALSPHQRPVLHQRIEKRFRQMLEQGFLAEVEALHQRGDLNPELPAIRAVGYRQAWDYLDSKLDYEAMIERGIIATRQLAKRQYTWLRSWENLQWIYTDQEIDEHYEERQLSQVLAETLNYLKDISI